MFLLDVGVEAFDIWILFAKLRTLFVVILLALVVGMSCIGN